MGLQIIKNEHIKDFIRIIRKINSIVFVGLKLNYR
jgi:hypothetical protein